MPLLAILLSVAAPSGELKAQDQPDAALLARCEAADLEPAQRPLCRDAAISLELLQPEFGLALASGNPVLGTASPIPGRFRFLPRFHIGGRVSFAPVTVPNTLDFSSGNAGSGGRLDFTLFAPQVDLSVGIFEGAQLGSTLDGFASIELLASLTAVVTPAGEGFQNDATGYGLGARVGLLRESFIAPGISFSALYKWFGRIRQGDLSAGQDARVGLDMRVASLRAGISKSFAALGLAITLGYDSHWSDVSLALRDPSLGETTVVAEDAPLELQSERFSAFVDFSYIVVFANFVAELGWQEAQDLVTSTGDEITSGNLFGSIGIRFTL